MNEALERLSWNRGQEPKGGQGFVNTTALRPSNGYAIKSGSFSEPPVLNGSASPRLDERFLEQILNIQKGIDEIKRAQDERDQSFQGFFQRELQTLKECLAQDFQKAKHDYLRVNNEGILKLFQSCDNRLGDILNIVADINRPVVDLDERGDVGREGPTNKPVGEVPEAVRPAPNGSNIAKSDDVPEMVGDKQGTKALVQEVSEDDRLWADFQEAVLEVEEEHNMYSKVELRLEQTFLAKSSVWHYLFAQAGLSGWLLTESPTNIGARITQLSAFSALQTFLILTNTMFMGYEADAAIKAALTQPKGTVPDWIDTCNLVYNGLFTVELLFRIASLRSWFFVAPGEWGWNFFDVIVVVFSLVTDLLLGSVNLSFIRTFRILRAVRAARVIRVLRFFRELRKIMFAILASMGSLIWCFIFLSMTMFMCSILLLQGIVNALDDLDPNSPAYASALSQAKEWYSTLPDSMFSLLAGFTGGQDWLVLREPLKPAGVLYTSCFVLYILFVTVGVMNVLTGVFLASADEFQDRSLIVQNEQIKVEGFVQQMLEVFADLNLSGGKAIDWPTFQEAMRNEGMQAYLAAHQLEPTHARLIFDLLDEKNLGQIGVLDFVMGMLRLKGEAKAIDARIIQREVGMLPKLINPKFHSAHASHPAPPHVEG